MNTRIIDTIPEGIFEEISIEMPDWKERFHLLLSKRTRIKFWLPNMPIISAEFTKALGSLNYEHQILKSDERYHFLVPR